MAHGAGGVAGHSAREAVTGQVVYTLTEGRDLDTSFRIFLAVSTVLALLALDHYALGGSVSALVGGITASLF